MIAGFTEPTKGTIKFGEKNITSLPPEKRNTAMVFKGYALRPNIMTFPSQSLGI